LWAILQPLGFSLIIGAVWSQVFKAQSVAAFVVYVFSGMLVWEYFSQTIIVGLDALINSRGYLKQARIPFLIFQMRVPLTGIVIFLFGLLGLLALMALLGSFPPIGVHLFLVPAYVAMLLLFVMPFGVLASIVGPNFRDARHIIGLALQTVFFLSPVMLERAVLQSDRIHLIQYLNPIVALLDLFRDPVLYGVLWSGQDVLVWAIWTGAMWVIALTAAVKAGRRIVFAI
jgi:lipopolysaccharide transport system permease protein